MDSSLKTHRYDAFTYYVKQIAKSPELTAEFLDWAKVHVGEKLPKSILDMPLELLAAIGDHADLTTRKNFRTALSSINDGKVMKPFKWYAKPPLTKAMLKTVAKTINEKVKKTRIVDQKVKVTGRVNKGDGKVVLEFSIFARHVHWTIFDQAQKKLIDIGNRAMHKTMPFMKEHSLKYKNDTTDSDVSSDVAIGKLYVKFKAGEEPFESSEDVKAMDEKYWY